VAANCDLKSESWRRPERLSSTGEILEVARHWPSLEPSSLVRVPGGCMARIITGLYKHHAHASPSAYIARMIHEGSANPLPLVNWIHRQNIHLTQ
jgi:hypothetical protein